MSNFLFLPSQEISAIFSLDVFILDIFPRTLSPTIRFFFFSLYSSMLKCSSECALRVHGEMLGLVVVDDDDFFFIERPKIFLMCAQITSSLSSLHSICVCTRWIFLYFFSTPFNSSLLPFPIEASTNSFTSNIFYRSQFFLSLSPHRTTTQINKTFYIVCTHLFVIPASLPAYRLLSLAFFFMCVMAYSGAITMKKEWVVHHRVCSTSSLNFFLPFFHLPPPSFSSFDCILVFNL